MFSKAETYGSAPKNIRFLCGKHRKLLEEVESSPKRFDIRLKQNRYLQPIITQYFIDNKSEIWLLFLIAHSKR